MVGLRERKKQRTRRALIEAALRLFDEKGYEETTLAEIAAAADVSTRTFFSYFASKEDVLFDDSEHRIERALAYLAARRPGQPPVDLLRGFIEHMLTTTDDVEELWSEHTALRLRLITQEPQLQARALHLLFDSQLRLARALREAYPDLLGPVEAAAAVGALIGAVKLAVMATLADDRPMEQAWDAARRAADVALSGVRCLGG
ncbi:MAG: TetR family transcriptional regulator [Nonomuraea sp.]|nr:TetR family transcriptional regulator [Nonomuraea sp.]NUP67947.1 TetR family transcriptional regulator [Nonomuraea sp.]NUP77195.1 TetR family transcriptional regulator [Nonomuraea sp.]NUS01280.1 TetR family transcriptional regulator [Nonomuraea sp.]NUT39347.1 TetR family transcriptional regulator [Thermoactinospora sp.]